MMLTQRFARLASSLLPSPSSISVLPRLAGRKGVSVMLNELAGPVGGSLFDAECRVVPQASRPASAIGKRVPANAALLVQLEPL